MTVAAGRMEILLLREAVGCKPASILAPGLVEVIYKGVTFFAPAYAQLLETEEFANDWFILLESSVEFALFSELRARVGLDAPDPWVGLMIASSPKSAPIEIDVHTKLDFPFHFSSLSQFQRHYSTSKQLIEHSHPASPAGGRTEDPLVYAYLELVSQLLIDGSKLEALGRKEQEFELEAMRRFRCDFLRRGLN